MTFPSTSKKQDLIIIIKELIYYFNKMFQDEILKISSEFFPLCPTIDGRYKILIKLGEGRFGKVYLCYD